MVHGQTRDMSLDVMRLCACLMVCFQHMLFAMNCSGRVPGLHFFLCAFTEADVPLFFMVSGALLLAPPGSAAPPDVLRRLGRRMAHILVPLFLWSTLYIFLSAQDGYLKVRLLKMLFAASGAGNFWFLYLLAGMYLILPVLNAWVRTAGARVIGFYLCVWGAMTFFPYVGRLIGMYTGQAAMFYYVSGYIGFFVAGYFLRWYGPRLLCTMRRRVAALLGTGIFALCLPFAEDAAGVPNIGEWGDTCGAAALTVFLYIAIAWACGQHTSGPRLALLSRLTFGFYLISSVTEGWSHQLAMKLGLGLVGTFLAGYALCLILSFGAAWVLSRLPFSYWTIGLRRPTATGSPPTLPS